MTAQERNIIQHFRKTRPDRGMTECYWDAKRHIHFVKTFTDDMKARERRSKAAKKAWKARRAASA